MEKEKKEFSVLKINKSTIIELTENDMSTMAAGTEILSIGQLCSCYNSCDRDNIPMHCCSGANHPD